MLKLSTRIFTGATMAALLIGLNTGAFACDGCVEAPAKTGAKATKSVSKVVASAKIAPKTAKKSVVKLASAKTAVKPTVKMCPMCEAEKAPAKK